MPRTSCGLYHGSRILAAKAASSGKYFYLPPNSHYYRSMSSSNSFDLTGRHAFVTGGVRGIGFEIARGLAQAGASVLISGREQTTVESSAAELRKNGLAVDAVALDMTDDQAVTAWFDGYEREIDILVNNVGMRDRRGTPDLPPDAFARLLDFGITSAYRMTRLVQPGMAARVLLDKGLHRFLAVGLGGAEQIAQIVTLINDRVTAFVHHDRECSLAAL